MNDSVSETADREISTTPVFNAPRHVVWKAWTDPMPIARWWGSYGFTTTTREYAPGGAWLFTMHGPDGTDHRNDVLFAAVVAPEMIEYDHGSSPVFHVRSNSRRKANVKQDC
ncbi:MAG: SRPBCC domain-containing protein [Pyrinomonadaceae bacterium]